MTKEEYTTLIRPYADASSILLTKLDILNHSSLDQHSVQPISNIQSRIKSQESLEKKLKKKGYAPTVDNARENIRDIAGIRAVCYFKQDISDIADSLKSQSDMVVIVEKDYIRNPKENGYRSYHIVLGIPVYYFGGMEYFPVELQLRTLSMDFWASMEHRIVYKQMNKTGKPNTDRSLSSELCRISEQLQDIESRFEQISGGPHS